MSNSSRDEAMMDGFMVINENNVKDEKYDIVKTIADSGLLENIACVKEDDDDKDKEDNDSNGNQKLNSSGANNYLIIAKAYSPSMMSLLTMTLMSIQLIG
ncbi:hypothetical protein RJT34_12303 [Clitoria ternatea]|uniref:Uncharacterized protein n=1 Tax=Clitoria ternatea TaxID=43366 RepID=A0AAN9JNK6_CLITE